MNTLCVQKDSHGKFHYGLTLRKCVVIYFYIGFKFLLFVILSSGRFLLSGYR